MQANPDQKHKYTFIDLFAGCGGLSEGFLQTGKYEGIAHIEWESPMVNTLRQRLTDRWEHTVEDALKRVIKFDIQKTEELLLGGWNNETKFDITNGIIILNKKWRYTNEKNRA